MQAYVLYTIAILFSLFTLRLKYINILGYCLMFVVGAGLYSLRYESVGTDTINYISIFNNSHDFSLSGINFEIEPLFLFFTYLVRSITESYEWFFFSIYVIFFIFWKKIIERLAVHHLDIAWGLVMLASPFMLLFNITRQSLAIVITLFSISLLLSNRYRLFVVFSITAFLIHYSAIFLIFAVLVVRKYNNPIIYIFATPVVIMFVFTVLSNLVNKILNLSSRYDSYLELNESGVNGVMLIVLILIKFFLFFYIYILEYKNNKNFRIMLSLFSIGGVGMICFKLLGVPDDGINRLFFGFLFTEVILFTYFFDFVSKLNYLFMLMLKMLFYFYIIFMFFFSIYSGALGLFPYHLSPAGLLL